MSVKTVLKEVLSEPILGAIDYWRHPEMRNTWGRPFKGQRARMALFRSLIAKVKPSAILETGTFRGATTEFMAQAGVPIFTVERDPRNYGFSRARFLHHRNVTVGKALMPAYIEPGIATHDLQVFYPSAPSSEETGARRGCVVLAKRTLNAATLASIPELLKLE
jgi:hypothetical protein